MGVTLCWTWARKRDDGKCRGSQSVNYRDGQGRGKGPLKGRLSHNVLSDVSHQSSCCFRETGSRNRQHAVPMSFFQAWLEEARLVSWTVPLPTTPNSFVKVLNPRTSEYALIWRWGFYWGDQVKVRSWGWTLIQYDRSACKMGKFWTQTSTQGTSIWCERMQQMATCKQAKERGLE